MTYRIPLKVRLRYARNKRDRYHRDPDYRLACINKERARRGAPLIAALEEMGDPRAGNRDNALRDEQGRFA